jgi:2,4-dienoyl-CoA reductase-like NADH-dependent reductase (Old Yellow Enzyme family)
MPYTTILTHPGGAHKDEFLACCLLLAENEVPIVRREPTPEDLADPATAVVDVGALYAVAGHLAQEDFLAGLDRFSLGYLHVVDGLAFGFHGLGEPMTLAEFRQVFRGPLIGNCGYTQETAEAAIESGTADLVAFGRPYISNPDLVERFAHGWPLAKTADMADWYAPSGAKGYTDFPGHRSTG